MKRITPTLRIVRVSSYYFRRRRRWGDRRRERRSPPRACGRRRNFLRTPRGLSRWRRRCRRLHRHWLRYRCRCRTSLARLSSHIRCGRGQSRCGWRRHRHGRVGGWNWRSRNGLSRCTRCQRICGFRARLSRRGLRLGDDWFWRRRRLFWLLPSHEQRHRLCMMRIPGQNKTDYKEYGPLLKAHPEYLHYNCLSTFFISPAAWRPQEAKPGPTGTQKP